MSLEKPARANAGAASRFTIRDGLGRRPERPDRRRPAAPGPATPRYGWTDCRGPCPPVRA
ncbi:hypothetical protein OEM_36270 [Mycobacterium intracellulare subsp. yongonense 05-1390]|uniref:Short-chain dehydrogenase/reductase SDR n=1 Tax=Mycobacterium indicus pranii (strain DSM 45239 / MTCC 9506) TaxID=1232724 RepID=J9WF54_MYCIP|nr:hypothetical protein OCQ_36880 [Mycobacterium paraintracellulare]AFS15635.1 Short-chain dehydrogenase/reductase SDR [Mycobacterium intracellulare subsp. intracellulare MTCC 9506]AGP65162.1 hypothetical protein OEM_36270 [Mycobacterium intracellulare subsp. yongonense 05-1390]